MKAARLGEVEQWLIMKDYWNEGPKGGYHQQCYQEYTDINKVSKEEQSHCNTRQDRDGESVGQSSGIEPSCKRVCRSQLQTFDIDNCEICQKDKVKKAYGKGARTREPLTLIISEFGSATLIKAARIWNDSCMLLHIDGRDTIAMEIKYHRSCYMKKKSSLRQKPFGCQLLLKNTLPSLQRKE